MNDNNNYLQQQMISARRRLQNDEIHEVERKFVAGGGKIGVLPGMSVSYERQKQLMMVDRTVNRRPDTFVDHPIIESQNGDYSNPTPLQKTAIQSIPNTNALMQANDFSINKDISAEYVRNLHAKNGNNDSTVRKSVNF